MKDIKIVVATHKKYQMPEDSMYVPVHVGAKGKSSIGYTRDSAGDNISDQNSSFSELTGLYWAWKNLKSDYLGLVHYRRYFKGKSKGKLYNQILSYLETDALLDKAPIIVTKKRKYYIMNIYDHYCNTMHQETLDTAIKIIKRDYPEYSDAIDTCMKRTYMHGFNMFIMRRDLLDEYLTWLFDILFKLTDELKDKAYDSFHARYPGRVSERLLDVWLTYKGYEFVEVPFVYMEKVNKLKKGISFLQAKILKKKYDGSF